MEENITDQIKGNEEELNFLFKEGLDGLRDDLIEATENVDLYYKAISGEAGGKELYGPQYNDALKIKGLARDRFLKFLALLKDRVGKKEDRLKSLETQESSGFVINHNDINNYISQNFDKEEEDSLFDDVDEVEEELPDNLKINNGED